jgi:NitT/TauT family transport system substrate-binding protein
MSAVKSSVYAIGLQMASKQQCHDPFLLEPNTVTMANPEGMASLINGQVQSHFSAYPFVDFELKQGNGKIHSILNSYDTMGGPGALIVLVGRDSFRTENPKVYNALVTGLEEAMTWIKSHKKEAAQLYIDEEHSKEPIEQVIAQLSSPDVIYDIAPKNITKFAHFMKEVGTVKRDWDWKSLSSPNLYNRNGS